MVTAEQMTKTLAVNAIAPLMLSKALVPLLKMNHSGKNRSMIEQNYGSH